MRTRMTLVCLCLLLTMGVSLNATAGAASDVPKFADYPARLYTGKRAPLRLTASDREFRTRLTDAYTAPIDFAGKYVLALWGCGTECLAGAAIDTSTGRVRWLPIPACCFGELEGDPIINRVNSRLLVIVGQRTDGMTKTWFYELTAGGTWKLRGSALPSQG